MFKRIGCIGCLLTVIVLSLPLLIGLLLPDSDVDTVVVTAAPAVAPEPTATPVLPPTTEPAATSAPLPFPGVYPYTDSTSHDDAYGDTNADASSYPCPHSPANRHTCTGAGPYSYGYVSSYIDCNP